MNDLVNAAPGRRPPLLEVIAERRDTDPCDVACEAMPAHVAGDLTSRDETWLHEHTRVCTYCANELRRYDKLDALLSTIGGTCDQAWSPPPLALPRRAHVWYTRVDSPIGELILAATAEGLREVDFAKESSDEAFVARMRQGGADVSHVARIDDAEPAVRQHLERAARELEEYFGGRRSRFDIPLDWGPMPPFQRAVLEATAAVPFGHVDTYAGIARRIGKPKATRAVGNALGRNPIPVIVPCHRVIRSDATLGGYTGGLGIKQHLLRHEGVTIS